ncbi:MAG: trypsin-like peptidase domain-containing protein [Planctomycetota bacterium]
MTLHCTILSGHRAHTEKAFDQDIVRISRGSDADLQLDPKLDRGAGVKGHVEIHRRPDGYTVRCTHRSGAALIWQDQQIDLRQGEEQGLRQDVELQLGKNGPRIGISVGSPSGHAPRRPLPAAASFRGVAAAARLTLTNRLKTTPKPVRRALAWSCLLLVAGSLAVGSHAAAKAERHRLSAQLSDVRLEAEERWRAQQDKAAQEIGQINVALEASRSTVLALNARVRKEQSNAAKATAKIKQLRERLNDVEEAEQSNAAKANATIEELREKLDEVGREVRKSVPQMLRDASPSIAVVGLIDNKNQFSMVGTAWVAKKRKLATNAHVINELRKQYKDARAEDASIRAIARFSSGNARDVDLDLEASRTHKGYDVFRKHLATHIVDGRNGRLARYGPGRSIELFKVGIAYDVGYLVTKTDAGPVLPIASEAQLQELAPGDAIGYAGYPSEGLLATRIRTNPEIHVGHLTAMTNFVSQADTFENSLILAHTIPTVGGASGSPLIDENGLVIGLVSHGSAKRARTKHGAAERIMLGFNYGQRVTLLREMLTYGADLTPSSEIRNELQHQFDALDVISPKERAHQRARFGAEWTIEKLVKAGHLPAGSVLDVDDCRTHVVSWDKYRSRQQQEVFFKSGEYIIVAATDLPTDLRLAATHNGNIRWTDTNINAGTEVLSMTITGIAKHVRMNLHAYRKSELGAPGMTVYYIFPVIQE